MIYEDLVVIKKHLTRDKIQNPVVEIGSRIVTSHSEYNLKVRKMFKGFEYYGVDIFTGNNVDLLGDAEHLPFKSNSIGTLISIGVLEHLQQFWVAMEEFYRVLKKGCYLFIATVFNFPVHGNPDYWRFAPEGLSYLVRKFEDAMVVGEGKIKDSPKGIYVIAKK